MNSEPWPSLNWPAWRDTGATLHMWTQIVGKIRLAQAPMMNHWWQVPLYVTCRGLTTSPIPYGARSFAIDFDFIDHALKIQTSDGASDGFPLRPLSVAEFYRDIMGRLQALGLGIRIWPVPVEIAQPIPFAADHEHRAYDAEHAQRFWRILVQADRVLGAFRARFCGKVSPVHFFWGSFDLALTRFSGRRAPLHPGGIPGLPNVITREAYSHEVSSAGFWPGNDAFPRPAFYSYAYPVPAGYRDRHVSPEAYFDSTLGEFIMPYDSLRSSADPDALLLDFLSSTYAAAADSGQWDRASLECPLGAPARVREI